MTTSKKRGSRQGRADNIGSQRAAIAFAGRGWGRMGPANDVELARLVKQTVWNAASSSMVGTRLDRYTVALVKNRWPAALAAFGEPSIIALLRRPAPGSCSWCAARVLSAASDQPPPKPTPALRELLGSPCSRCQVAHEAAEVAERERALAASGYRRDREPAPTGMLWPAGQEPSGVVTSARRAARNAPGYYRPGRPT